MWVFADGLDGPLEIVSANGLMVEAMRRPAGYIHPETPTGSCPFQDENPSQQDPLVTG